MSKKKWVTVGRRVNKKRWAVIAEKFSCADDVLAILHEDLNLSQEFKTELTAVQVVMSKLADKIWKKSLSKKERLEVYGK